MMLERSLVQLGNNYRMKKALQKLEQGKNTTIAFLGGSITEQKSKPHQRGYAMLYTKYLIEQFHCEENLQYINAANNAYSSVVGRMRLEKDVLIHQPDIVILEYAVNDAKDALHRENYESLILRLLHYESQPAVILLFMISQTGHTCQGQMQVLGEHYHLPMISFGEAIMPEINAGQMRWEECAEDTLHPNQYGHNLISNMLQYYTQKVMSVEWDGELELPMQPFYGDTFRFMQYIDSQNINIISNGSFHPETTLEEFPNGWVYSPDGDNKGLQLHLKCKNLIIFYLIKNDTNMGDAKVWIDGEPITVLQGYSIFGWGNAVYKLLLQETNVQEHTLEIRMLKEDINKKFIILAIGYSDK